MDLVKRGLLGAIAAATIFVGDASAQQATDPFIRTTDAVKRSISPIVCLKLGTDRLPNGFNVDGSAFFVSETGTFLTAGHVARDFQPGRLYGECPVPAVYFRFDRGQPSIDVQWFQFAPKDCAIDDKLDLARCKTVDNLTTALMGRFKPTPVLLETALVPDGTVVAFTGFPLSVVTPLTSRANVAGYFSDDPKMPTIVIDKNAWPGASGSPIYLMNGKVVGMINRRGVADAAGLAFGRSALALAAFLKANP